MLYALVLVPLAMAALAALAPGDRIRPRLLPLGAAAELALCLWTIHSAHPSGASPALGGWLMLDALGRLFLVWLNVFFLITMLYAPGYLAARSDRPNRVFCANLFLVQAMMTLVTLAHHLGLLWVAMESTTLATAPLLYFNRNTRSLEATWKYLVIGSVGIALALLGSFFLAYARLSAGLEPSLLFDDLVREAHGLSVTWLHAAFALLLIGYGTKLGLAPVHTWKPDAYGEAPGLAGAILAGAVSSCAFLAILRVYQICQAAEDAGFAAEMFVFAGLFSIAIAAASVARERDIKRMLAYSSVEHMGLLVLGVGLGGKAIYGALLHLINHGLAKGVLFLSAGNIHRAYGSKQAGAVTGAMRVLPGSAALFLAGFFAIAGSPPFGPFTSELVIAGEAAHQGRMIVLLLAILGVAVVFVGMSFTVLTVVQGEPPCAPDRSHFREHAAVLAPAAIFLALVLGLGLVIPDPVDRLLVDAARALEPSR